MPVRWQRSAARGGGNFSECLLCRPRPPVKRGEAASGAGEGSRIERIHPAPLFLHRLARDGVNKLPASLKNSAQSRRTGDGGGYAADW